MATTLNVQLQVPFVDLRAEYDVIESEVIGAISGLLRKTDFILGKETRLLEQEFALFCGAKHAVGVDSGFSALEMILRAYGIGAGDEVIIPANTFIATALAISAVGATPVLVDHDPVTYNIDVSAIEGSITRRTAAIMPVHLYGQPADMDEINKIAEKHGLLVIEDSCQSHGALYHGKRAGALGHAAAFSFYPAKNLGAYGDGGIVVTSDSKVAQYIEMDRNYGQREKFHHVIQGHNHRLDTLQAAVLRIKLRRLERQNAARRVNAQLYREFLANADVVLPEVAPGVEPVWHLFVIRIERRDELRKFLDSRGIASGIHYPIPIHLHEAYSNLGYRRGDFPVSEGFAEQILSLPMYPDLRREMIEYVAEAVTEFCGAGPG
jgi:dTDP-4-amino-4,6-dideoxygalactose transaminase